MGTFVEHAGVLSSLGVVGEGQSADGVVVPGINVDCIELVDCVGRGLPPSVVVNLLTLNWYLSTIFRLLCDITK